MAWRFEPGEDLKKAFRRVAEEEIASVRAGLAGEADRASAIHEARQGFKRLRALAGLRHLRLADASRRRTGVGATPDACSPVRATAPC